MIAVASQEFRNFIIDVEVRNLSLRSMEFYEEFCTMPLGIFCNFREMLQDSPQSRSQSYNSFRLYDNKGNFNNNPHVSHLKAPSKQSRFGRQSISEKSLAKVSSRHKIFNFLFSVQASASQNPQIHRAYRFRKCATSSKFNIFALS